MIIIIIHAETGDTIAAVASIRSLKKQGINFSVVPNLGQIDANKSLKNDILQGNADLVEDLQYIIDGFKVTRIANYVEKFVK